MKSPYLFLLAAFLLFVSNPAFAEEAEEAADCKYWSTNPIRSVISGALGQVVAVYLNHGYCRYEVRFATKDGSLVIAKEIRSYEIEWADKEPAAKEQAVVAPKNPVDHLDFGG